jgi:hypothetical protein
LCQNVLYHIGNCVSLYQYGERFPLMITKLFSFISQKRFLDILLEASNDYILSFHL